MRMKIYFVYILKSLHDGTRYFGMTSDLNKRMQEHNAGKSTFTSGHGPYECIWYCAFRDQVKAHAFERYLKTGSGYAFTRKHLV